MSFCSPATCCATPRERTIKCALSIWMGTDTWMLSRAARKEPESGIRSARFFGRKWSFRSHWTAVFDLELSMGEWRCFQGPGDGGSLMEGGNEMNLSCAVCRALARPRTAAFDC